MDARVARNWINVRPGNPAFSVANNMCDYFELGDRTGSDYWLEGDTSAGDYVFNGRLFVPGHAEHGTVIDNFPKGPTPQGWEKRPIVGEEGYSLVAKDGTLLFGYRVDENICVVTANIYARDGEIVAESLPHELRLRRNPARIGRGGIRFG